MNAYIAFLRGINVSGQKKIKMADLKMLFEALGFEEVRTYIQSGNVVFKSDLGDPAVLQNTIERELNKAYSVFIPTLILKRKDLLDIYEKNPFSGNAEDMKKICFVLLQEEPEEDRAASLAKERFPNENFIITRECVYLQCLNGFGRAKCNNNFFEKRLRTKATSRNHRTITQLLALSKP